jgi:acyl-coenzyme A synthetase/AMP-(fatty) acid ligase
MNKLITPNFIKHWAIQNPRKISIIWGDKKYSYYWTADSIAKFIIFLKLQGLKKEQTVVIKVKHRVLELIITFALEAIGAIRVAQIEDSKLAEKCNFCISDHKLEKLNIKNIHLTTSLLETIFSYELLPEDLNLLDYAPQPDDLILISHTSGTTGKKKYFADTHYGHWANLFLMKSIYFANDEDTFLSINSIAVGAAYAGCCLALICGGKIIFTNEYCL